MSQSDKKEYCPNWNTLVEFDYKNNKPQICIPKTGDLLFVNITRKRYLIIIGRLVVSSVSGVWWRRRIKK